MNLAGNILHLYLNDFVADNDSGNFVLFSWLWDAKLLEVCFNTVKERDRFFDVVKLQMAIGITDGI